MISIQHVARNGKNLGMIIGISLLIPPTSTVELSETDKINAAASFSKELASPLIQQFALSKLGLSFGCIKVTCPAFRRIVALAHTVQ